MCDFPKFGLWVCKSRAAEFNELGHGGNENKNNSCKSREKFWEKMCVLVRTL